jgi:lysophospholipase L1-like esterase
MDAQTVRQIVHISIGGDRLRVRLSNVFGKVPLTIDAASLGVQSEGANIDMDSLRQLTFGGQPFIKIPPGARVVSDPVDITVDAQEALAISIYVAKKLTPQTTHAVAMQTSYVSPRGNFTDRETMPVEELMTSWYWLTGVEVLSDATSRAVVTVGDSITDGDKSTVDANARYPNVLARRLLERYRGAERISVLNSGISGNRILTDGTGLNVLARLDRDALVQSGVSYIIFLQGINDIGFSELDPATRPANQQLTDVSAAEIIAGIDQIIARTHSFGIKIFGGTLPPFKGAGYFSEDGERKRQAVNEWIRTSDAFDGVIDFDAVLRDPSDPERLFHEYDSGDNLHPSDAGYEAMGEAVNLILFQR